MVLSLLKYLRFTPLHIILWVGVWFFYVYFFGYASSNTDFAVRFATSLLPVTIIVTYTIAYHLIPKFLFTKKYWLFSLYTFYTVVASLFIVLILTFFNLIFLSEMKIDKMPLLSRNLVFVMIMIYIIVGIVSFIQLLQHNLKTTNRNQELENKLLEGQLQLKERELYYLKQQIHPHFLFNTLNTVYGFALKQSKETPELILKLSNLLDYILNQIDKPTVPISEEIKHIEAYIGLEEVRFRDTLDIAFAKAVTQDIRIPPMLFISLVENAFKHGSTIDNILKIDINLEATEREIKFDIKNSYIQKNQTEDHGLGLKNTRKRLETLYPNRHILTNEIKRNIYHTQLIINTTIDA